MLIIGNGGHAKEIYDILDNIYKEEDIFFYDDVNVSNNKKIIQSIETAKSYLKEKPEFCLGLGNPKYRELLLHRIENIGGKVKSVIAHSAIISERSVVKIKTGVNIMHQAFIGPDVVIGMGALINAKVNIHHDVTIGDFSEIGPGSIILGGASIGRNTTLGGGVIVLPNIKVGNGCIIGAGSVVTKNIMDGSLAYGNPCNIIKSV